MKVTPDGQTLIVRGYIGFELLGHNQYWTRLPDSAYSMLDPSVNPNPPRSKHSGAAAQDGATARRIRRIPRGSRSLPSVTILARLLRLARLAHQHRLEQRRRRHRGEQRDRQQLAHARRAGMAGKPQAAEGGRRGQALNVTARVSTDCSRLVCPSRHAMM